MTHAGSDASLMAKPGFVVGPAIDVWGLNILCVVAPSIWTDISITGLPATAATATLAHFLRLIPVTVTAPAAAATSAVAAAIATVVAII